MRVRWKIEEAYQCDACGAVAETAGGIPDGWGEYSAWVSGRGVGPPVYTEHLPDVHVCRRCLDRAPGIVGRRVQEFLTPDGAAEEEATHGA